MECAEQETDDIYDNARKVAVELIQSERKRQDEKFPNSRHNAKTWLLIAQEEIGELAHEILAGTPEGAQHELIQCAAVFQAMLEQFIVDGVARNTEHSLDNGVLIPKSDS